MGGKRKRDFAQRVINGEIRPVGIVTHKHKQKDNPDKVRTDIAAKAVGNEALLREAKVDERAKAVESGRIDAQAARTNESAKTDERIKMEQESERNRRFEALQDQRAAEKEQNERMVENYDTDSMTEKMGDVAKTTAKVALGASGVAATVSAVEATATTVSSSVNMLINQQSDLQNTIQDMADATVQEEQTKQQQQAQQEQKKKEEEGLAAAQRRDDENEIALIRAGGDPGLVNDGNADEVAIMRAGKVLAQEDKSEEEKKAKEREKMKNRLRDAIERAGKRKDSYSKTMDMVDQFINNSPYGNGGGDN